MIPWDFVRDSKTGAMGDPTTASHNKGMRIAEAAVEAVVELAKQLLLLKESDLRTGFTRNQPVQT
jgi:creatinine amidohydrolase/Fe(II)-dependent formamide hydrolase-like protein